MWWNEIEVKRKEMKARWFFAVRDNLTFIPFVPFSLP